MDNGVPLDPDSDTQAHGQWHWQDFIFPGIRTKHQLPLTASANLYFASHEDEVRFPIEQSWKLMHQDQYGAQGQLSFFNTATQEEFRTSVELIFNQDHKLLSGIMAVHRALLADAYLSKPTTVMCNAGQTRSPMMSAAIIIARQLRKNPSATPYFLMHNALETVRGQPELYERTLQLRHSDDQPVIDVYQNLRSLAQHRSCGLHQPAHLLWAFLAAKISVEIGSVPQPNGLMKYIFITLG